MAGSLRLPSAITTCSLIGITLDSISTSLSPLKSTFILRHELDSSIVFWCVLSKPFAEARGIGNGIGKRQCGDLHQFHAAGDTELFLNVEQITGVRTL